MNNKGYVGNFLAYTIIVTLVLLFMLAVKGFMTHQAQMASEGKTAEELLDSNSDKSEAWMSPAVDDADTRVKELNASGPISSTVIKRRVRAKESPVIKRAIDILKVSSVGHRAYGVLALQKADVLAAGGIPQTVSLSGWGVAWVDGEKTLYIDDAMLRGFPDELVAALIAHAAEHADYALNRTYWTELVGSRHAEFKPGEFSITPGSVEDEYTALRCAVLVWGETKRGKTNVCFDAWGALYEQGEAFTRALIRLQLPGGTSEF